MMNQEERYVDFFYRKYPGRLALGVGYDESLTEIFPFVFINDKGDALGGIALSPIEHDEGFTVHIFHISSFVTNCGDGTTMLRELCQKADDFSITLCLSPVAMSNGTDDIMDSGQLKKWYEQYGFQGKNDFCREPLHA